MKQSLCPVTSNVEISPGVRLMWVKAPDIAVTAQPGQFITIRCEGSLLRRPLSIHQVSSPSPPLKEEDYPHLSSPLKGEDSGEGRFAILFQVVGKGTLWLSQRQTGDKIDIFGPLGRGFDIPSVIVRHTESQQENLPKQSKNLLLIAGGIGIAPLVFLAQYASLQHQVTLIHGVSTAAQLYPFSSSPLTLNSSPLKGEEKGEGEKQNNILPLPNKIRFIPVTEDGSMGKKGVVTDVLPDFLDWADQICACGPIDMYKAMAKLSLRAEAASRELVECRGNKRSNLKLRKCQVSLEVRMGCGFGACYGCTINTKKGLKQVCHDGPVFELDDIIWEEVRI